MPCSVAWHKGLVSQRDNTFQLFALASVGLASCGLYCVFYRALRWKWWFRLVQSPHPRWVGNLLCLSGLPKQGFLPVSMSPEKGPLTLSSPLLFLPKTQSLLVWVFVDISHRFWFWWQKKCPGRCCPRGYPNHVLLMTEEAKGYGYIGVWFKKTEDIIIFLVVMCMCFVHTYVACLHVWTHECASVCGNRWWESSSTALPPHSLTWGISIEPEPRWHG